MRTDKEVLFRLPEVDYESLGEIAEAVGERRAALLRSIVKAALTKLASIENPPTTLGGIENAIIK